MGRSLRIRTDRPRAAPGLVILLAVVALAASRVNASLIRLHDDGTLARLSREYFKRDYASAAARFDLAGIGQTVR